MLPIQPAGLTPASLWSIPAPSGPLRPEAILSPELAPSTGQRLSLDVSADPTMTAIGVQLRTLRGSGVSVEDDGNTLPEIRKNLPDTPSRIEFELARLLAPFVEQGLITVAPPSIVAGPDAGNKATVEGRVKLLRPGAEPTEPV